MRKEDIKISDKVFNSFTVNKLSPTTFLFKIDKNNIGKLSKHEVVIKSHYSTINYKDILICRGNPGLVRKFPHIPGIDIAGEIVLSKSKKFKIGDKVTAVCQPTGINTSGGWSEYVKIPDKWIEKIPRDISLKKAMVIGTAGFTAMYSALKLTKLGLKKNNGPVLVTGATGGVGAFSILIFSKMGFHVQAVTRKIEMSNYLKNLGAKEVIAQSELDNNPVMPLLNHKFSAVIDSVGGNVLSTASKFVIAGGKVACIGNALSGTVNMSLMPLILRGIDMIGINAEMASNKERQHTWRSLTKISNSSLDKIFKEYKFEDLQKVISNLTKEYTGGRRIIKFL